MKMMRQEKIDEFQILIKKQNTFPIQNHWFSINYNLKAWTSGNQPSQRLASLNVKEQQEKKNEMKNAKLKVIITLKSILNESSVHLKFKSFTWNFHVTFQSICFSSANST